MKERCRAHAAGSVALARLVAQPRCRELRRLEASRTDALDRGEAAPVVAADAKLPDRLTVRAGGVADVGVPAVTGIARRKPSHQAVAGDLGDDRGGADRRYQSVAVDDGLHRAGQIRSLAIHQRKLWQGGSRGASRALMASRLACRMLKRSISTTEAAPIPIRARARNRPASRSRSWAHNTLESARPLSGRSRITAAATTGPASGPRPTSSTPATNRP